ncbi:MAG: Imm63 family immunity protein [Candidatus Lokiarchaeota archaeon]
MYSISTIRKNVREYGKKISAPKNLLTIHTSSDGFGTPYIEINKSGYNFVVSERGTEFVRKITKDFNKILYWIFEPIVFEMANDYELENRNPKEDNRKILFSKEIELMEKLDPQWAQWKKEDVEKILEEYPYDDSLV